MFQMIFAILIVTTFLFGCSKPKEPSKQENIESVKAQTAGAPSADKSAEIVTLKPEALEQIDLKTEVASLRLLHVEYSFPGKVTVNETRLAHVSSRIPGRAVEVYGNPGDYVKKGQPLSIIDSPELGEAQSQYLKAKTALQVAEKADERAKILLEGKVISTGEFQRRESEYLSAQAEAKVAEGRLHLLGMTDGEISNMDKAHTINSTVAIYTSITGTIIERHLTLGEIIESAKPLFVIADLANLWVIADVPENDIPKIKKGQGVAVTVSPYPEKVFKGGINYISETIDPDTRTIKVRVEVANPGGVLKPEMFATIKITTEKKEKVLAIPESAIQREGEKTFVFISKGENTFEKRVVEAGPEVGGFHQVISGIKAGEKIVTKGAFTLKSETMKGLMKEE